MYQQGVKDQKIISVKMRERFWLFFRAGYNYSKLVSGNSFYLMTGRQP
jgi:hypothetical protein